MKRRTALITLSALMSAGRSLADSVTPTFDVTLKDAHKGTLEVDTRLLDSYGKPPANQRAFYLDARAHFEANAQARFADQAIVAAAKAHDIQLMGGPMLGDLQSDGATIWMRPASDAPLMVRIGDRSFPVKTPKPGNSVRVSLTGLSPSTRYKFTVNLQETVVAEGHFMTAPAENDKSQFRVAFGSCCHKIGVHNPNLFGEIIKRQPHVMMMLGDIAVDDRNNNVNMHRADYQLRDTSEAWRNLVANVPVYASWDDHDYFDNDLSGIPRRYTADDRDNVRAVWHENWNNPPADSDREGIYFNSRVGPVEIIMLDTRSCRDGKRRNKYGAYLGEAQLTWLKKTLKESTAPFKIISSGTMWSDYVSKAKDSWGSWDKEAREEVFSLIEKDKIGGVLLVSGDRHGARGFKITRPSGFTFYEFEPATLGGVSGPAGIVKNCPEQLFGYSGRDATGQNFVACGEFTFDLSRDQPGVTFRLISQFGEILEVVDLTLDDLTPR